MMQRAYAPYITQDRGITLIELIVVVSIISILAVAIGFSFQGWVARYKVESQIKNIYVDLMNARVRAMQRNRIHFANFASTTSYEVYEDDSNGVIKVIDGDGSLQTGTGVTADTRLPSFPKTLNYAVTIGTSGVMPFSFRFNNRGIVSPESTICIFTDYDGDASHLSDYTPDYDCIVLSETRISMGRITTQNTAGGTCVDTNCVIK